MRLIYHFKKIVMIAFVVLIICGCQNNKQAQLKKEVQQVMTQYEIQKKNIHSVAAFGINFPEEDFEAFQKIEEIILKTTTLKIKTVEENKIILTTKTIPILKIMSIGNQKFKTAITVSKKEIQQFQNEINEYLINAKEEEFIFYNIEELKKIDNLILKSYQSKEKNIEELKNRIQSYYPESYH